MSKIVFSPISKTAFKMNLIKLNLTLGYTHIKLHQIYERTQKI